MAYTISPKFRRRSYFQNRATYTDLGLTVDGNGKHVQIITVHSALSGYLRAFAMSKDVCVRTALVMRVYGENVETHKRRVCRELFEAIKV